MVLAHPSIVLESRPTIENQLEDSLERVLSNRRNVAGACTLLNAFVTLVRAQSGRAIPVPKATALINQAC